MHEEVNGRRIRRGTDGRWRVEGWHDEDYEDREIVLHLLALEAESPALGVVNRLIVQAGGRPIELRPPEQRPREWPCAYRRAR
jgi:hypothetical protein